MQPTVVVGYDQTPSSEKALLEAAREACWHEAELSVVTAFQWLAAVPPMPLVYSPTEIEDSVRKAATRVAEHGAGIVRARYPAMAVAVLTKDGSTADVLADAAQAANLLVVGNRGRGGFAGLLLGSASMRTLDAATVPTMVVRGSDHDPRGLVVAAVDIAAPTGEPLEFAFAEASRRGARLEVLYARDQPWFVEDSDGAAEVEAAVERATVDLEADLATAMRPCQNRYSDVRATRHVTGGTVGAVLYEASRRADLLVMGAHLRHDGRRGMRVGPVARELLHHADCPVVVVPRA